MNVSISAGVNAYRRSAAPEKKTVAPKIAASRTPAGGQDRVQINYGDILTAEQEGYIEVGGKRFAVSDDMVAQMKRTYEQVQARNEAQAARRAAEENARNARAQTELLEKEAKSMKQAMEIARRIARGGIVPPQDEHFLLEFSQEMYMSAKMQGMLAKEHKKEDSALEDEKEETGGTEDDGGETHATVEAALSGGSVEGVSVGETGAETQ